MTETRKEVPALLQELRRACRRPLYTEVLLNRSRWFPSQDATTSETIGESTDTALGASTRQTVHVGKRVRESAAEKTWGEVRQFVLSTAFSYVSFDLC